MAGDLRSKEMFVAKQRLTSSFIIVITNKVSKTIRCCQYVLTIFVMRNKGLKVLIICDILFIDSLIEEYYDYEKFY